jgi:predicted transcriptional regulator
MRPPCEIVVKYVLPAFRSLVARELIEKHDYSQVAAAEKLSTTQAAVSQYLYSKRGRLMVKRFENLPAVRNVARKVASGIADGSLSSMSAMLKLCELCTVLRTKDLVCDMHRYALSLPQFCDACTAT